MRIKLKVEPQNINVSMKDLAIGTGIVAGVFLAKDLAEAGIKAAAKAIAIANKKSYLSDFDEYENDEEEGGADNE